MIEAFVNSYSRANVGTGSCNQVICHGLSQRTRLFGNSFRVLDLRLFNDNRVSLSPRIISAPAVPKIRTPSGRRPRVSRDRTAVLEASGKNAEGS